MRQGFIIIEWMIQFLLCTLIVIITLSLFRAWSTRLNLLHRKLDDALQMPHACDALHRDMLTTTAHMFEVRSDQCKMSQPGFIIRWRLKNNTLYRVQQNYDVKQRKWRKSIQNTVAEHVTACSFTPLYNRFKSDIVAGVRIGYGNQACIIGMRSGKEL